MATDTTTPPKRILIIDDEVPITELIAEVGKTAGFDVATVSNTADITRRYNEFAPQCVFLDLDLGDRDGVEVLQYLSIAECDAKIFIMSGMEPAIRENTRQIGLQMNLDIAGILPKPFRIEDILKLLATL